MPDLCNFSVQIRSNLKLVSYAQNADPHFHRRRNFQLQCKWDPNVHFIRWVGRILCSHNFFSGTFCFTYCMQSSRCTSYHGVVEKRFQCFCQFLIAISCDPASNFIVHIITTSSSSFDTVPNSLRSIYYQNSLHHFPSYHVGKHSRRFATAHTNI